MDAALGDDDPIPRRARHELELRAPVDPEGGEVARVDPDRVGAEAHGPLQFVRIVGLDERVEPELPRPLLEPRRVCVVEVAEQEQDAVGAGFRERGEVVLGAEEALAEEWQTRRRPRRTQVVEGAAEALVDEDRDRGRSRPGERGRESGGIGSRPKVSGGGGAPLDLGDRSEAGTRECVPEPAHVRPPPPRARTRRAAPTARRPRPS